MVFIVSGEEFVERRGPSPLTIKAEPDLGPSLKKILHLHLLSRHENDFINILYYLCLKVIIHFLFLLFKTATLCRLVA